MRRFSLARLIAPSIIFILFPVSLIPAQVTRQKFAAVVESNFKSWDSNHDGALSHTEVETLIRSHKVKGDAAAAVAALHVWFRNNSSHPPVSLAFIINSKDGQDERRDQTQKESHIQGNFASFSKHLSQVPRQIFTTSTPSVIGMSQGNLGDCYFVSPIGAFVHRDPTAIKHLVRTSADGSAEIDFGDGRHAKVSPMTDALICLGSTAHQQGLWLNVLEEGYGEIKKNKGPTTESAAAIDKISKGGDPGATITLLTGHKTQSLSLKKTPPEKTQQALLAARSARRLICAATSKGTEHPLPPGIPGNHAYAILDFNGSHLTIWNPWGNHFEPKGGGAPGIQHGYKVENGVFTVPMTDFTRIFSEVHIETEERHRHK